MNAIELVAIVKSGKLPRPGLRRGGTVAWAQAEVYAMKDWVAERREDGLPIE